jgi:hypothetical protein
MEQRKLSRASQAFAALLLVMAGLLLAGAAISASGTEGFRNDEWFDRRASVLVWVPAAVGGLTVLILVVTGLVRRHRGPLLWGAALISLLLVYFAYLQSGHH